MNEFERLQTFYPFDDETLASVERTAHGQESISWPDYARKINFPEPKQHRSWSGDVVEVIDIVPRDYENTLTYYLPMGCYFDSNMMIHVATLSQSQPDLRIVAVGNPGRPGRGAGKLSIKDAYKVWRGDFEPTIIPTMEYLYDHGVDKVSHAGISYGADKAAAAAAEDFELYDIEPIQSIIVEPVSVIRAGLIRMGITFAKTGKHAEKYLEPVRERSQAFVNAEELKDSALGYGVGLARLSNLAIGAALGRKGFERRMEDGLARNTDLRAGIAWGTASEFDEHGEREQISARLKTKFGSDRVVTMPLSGQTHAMNLDIFLNAALVSQLLKNPS